MPQKLFFTCGFIVTGFLLFEKGGKVINDNENLKVKSFTLKTEEIFKFKNLKHFRIKIFKKKSKLYLINMKKQLEKQDENVSLNKTTA